MEHTQQLLKRGKYDILSKHPIVEIVGQNRVLIENHQGVLGYSPDEIQIKVCYGCVYVKGSHLQLMQMSKAQLVVCGRIDGLQLVGR